MALDAVDLSDGSISLFPRPTATRHAGQLAACGRVDKVGSDKMGEIDCFSQA